MNFQPSADEASLNCTEPSGDAKLNYISTGQIMEKRETTRHSLAVRVIKSFVRKLVFETRALRPAGMSTLAPAKG